MPRLNSSGQARHRSKSNDACLHLLTSLGAQLCSLGFYTQSGTDLANMSVRTPPVLSCGCSQSRNHC
jgi:hypothetical protein